MNKKILSALLLAAFGFASSSMLVSCKDYDDDIKNLQTQIDGLKATLSEIQTKIQNGAILKSVNPITNGVEIVLDGGQTYKITNGKDGVNGTNGTDGKNGTVWTIGDDGYWYKDGAKTDYKAIGKDGINGTDGTNGTNGNDGKSAYQIAVDNGFKGTEAEWLESLKGQDGQSGSSAGTGIYYVPNTETGKFDLYKDGAFVEHTQISFLADPDQTQGGIISAVKTADALTLYGVEGGEGNLKTATISLSGVLKSLVFIPHFYLDGIETIEYPWFGDSTLVRKDGDASYKQGESNRSGMKHHGKTVANGGKIMSNYLPDNLSHMPQAAIPTREAVIYGPVIGVDYEINPSNAKLSWDANAPFYNVLEPDVVYANTRAAAKTLNVTSPKTYGLYTAPSKEVFGIKTSRSEYTEPYSKAVGNDGTGNSGVNYLQAGLKIEQPQFLEPYPTSQDLNGGYQPTTTELDGSYTTPAWINWYGWYKKDEGQHKNTDNTIALQLNNIENGSVTSDYALVIPSRLRLEGLVWTKNPTYDEPQFGPTTAQTGDEKGWYSKNDQVFIWDSPEEALDNDFGAALDLPIGEGSTVDLKEWIGIRILKENVKTRKVSNETTWKANEFNEDGKKYGQEEYYNLHYEFTLIDYQTSGNVTGDSRYATFNDTDLEAAAKFDITKSDEANANYISKTGIIRALTVDEQKKTMNVSSSTARDREPLVRILVKTNDGKVMLDGYILLRITETNPNLLVETYPEQEQKFNLCNSAKYVTDWAQFSKLVLQDAMKTSTFPTGYTKESFDAMYWADCIEGTADVSATDKEFVSTKALQVGTTLDGHKTYSMKIFNFGDDIYGNDGKPAALGNSNASLDPVKGTEKFEDKPLGVVEYFPNADGQTNHRWEWTLTKEEIDYLTKGKANGESVTVTRWIRFQAKNFTPGTDGTYGQTQDDYQAPWPYVWVKLTMKLTRDAMEAKYTKKIDNYWYHYSTGADLGWTGYLLDIEAPGSVSQTGHTPNFTPVTHAATGIKDENWFGRIANTLYTNIPVLTKYSADATATVPQTGWYYFAPKTSEIKGVSGTTYVITPKRSASDKLWDKLFDKYLVKDNKFTKLPTDVVPTEATIQYTQPNFTWKETTLQATLTGYAIDANRGAFTNDTLYANPKGTDKFYPIAYITKQAFSSTEGANSVNAGQIMLFHWLNNSEKEGQIDKNAEHENWVCYDVLNAIGYINGTKVSNENIAEQLHAWLGFVGTECGSAGTTTTAADLGVAFYVEQDQFDETTITDWNNKATVEASWERPINLMLNNPDDALDAKTNENTVYLVDNMKLYDWRGPKGTIDGRTFNLDGYMWDNHYWFWGWYNVQAAVINLNPAKVKIKLNDDAEWVALNTVSTQLRLRPLATAVEVPAAVKKDPYKTLLDGASFWQYTDLTQYASEDKESQIEQILGVNPANKVNKAKFGGFYYENISGNVTYFYVQIPVGVRYEWGWQFGTVTWKINTTQGN